MDRAFVDCMVVIAMSWTFSILGYACTIPPMRRELEETGTFTRGGYVVGLAIGILIRLSGLVASIYACLAAGGAI